MGGKNTKHTEVAKLTEHPKPTEDAKESRTEVCTNPRPDRAKIQFTLQRDTKLNLITLQALEFRINLPTRRSNVGRICSVSNDFYLLSDYNTHCVIKVQLSSGKIWSLHLPGYVEDLFFLEQSRAAVAIRNISSNYIHLIETGVLHVVKAFDIKNTCKGIAQIAAMFYIGHSNGIAVYNRNGERKEMIFDQDAGYSIKSMTKGTEDTLVCLQENDFSWFLKIVNTSGHLLRIFYSFYEYMHGSVFSPVWFSSVRTDLEGNLYVHNDKSCLKITQNGIAENIACPESRIVDVCFDANIDMLVFLCPEFLVLQSLNNSLT